MKKHLITGALAASVLLVGLTGCSTMAGDMKADSTTKTEMSSSPAATGTATMGAMAMSGTFAGLNEKKVAGMAMLSDGELKLTGFSSDEGPDLHVYLTNGTDEAAVSAGMRIDAVAFDKAEQMFKLAGVDASKYTDVVIYCDKAKAVFGAAKLS